MQRILAVLAVMLLLSGCGAPVAPAAQGGAASLMISGGDAPKSYTVEQLKALPQAQAQFKDVTYTGVAVVQLLRSAGFTPEQVRSVKAIASDGFTATYEPALFMRADLIVAFATVSGALAKEDGNLRTVLPGAEGKLNVRSLSELQITK